MNKGQTTIWTDAGNWYAHKRANATTILRWDQVLQKSSTMQPLTGSLSCCIRQRAPIVTSVLEHYAAPSAKTSWRQESLRFISTSIKLRRSAEKWKKYLHCLWVFLTPYYPYFIRDWLSLSLMNSKWFYWLGKCVDDTVCMSSDQSVDHNRSLTRSSTGLSNKKTSYQFCFQI